MAAKKAKRAPAKKAVAKKAVGKTTAKKTKVTAKKAVGKTTAKKAVAKVTAKKAAPAAKAVVAINVKKVAPVKQAYSKSAVIGLITEQAGVSRKQASAALEILSNVVQAHVGKGGCGEFKMPGLFKIVVIEKPARKARKGTNPFTGEEMMFKAKPAHKVVRVRPLKQLKEMVK